MAAYDIPADLDHWESADVTQWLADLEEDDQVPTDVLHRARQAARAALGVDD